MDAAPFRAVRYHPGVAGDPAATSAPSYDEVERFAYAEHRAASPYTVLELVAPPTGFAAARKTLQRWWRTGVLVRDPKPAFHFYEEHELRTGVPAVQRGILAAVRLHALDSAEDLLPHEAVDPERAASRAQRLEAVPLDVAPVFALVAGLSSDLHDLMARSPRHPPIAALTDDDGVDHRVWRIDADEDIEVVRAELGAARAVIADGHHRYAAALAFRDRQRARHGVVPDAPWERILVYVVDAHVHGPRIAPIHRLVRGLSPEGEAVLAEELALEPVSGGPRAVLARLAEAPDALCGLWRAGAGALARARDPAQLWKRLPVERSERWRTLDLAQLELGLLPRIAPPEAVEASSDLDACLAACGDAATLLFLLRPVDVGTVLDLAASGETMPAKGTSFRPKPRTGLVMREVVA